MKIQVLFISLAFLLPFSLVGQNPNLPAQHDYTWISGYEQNTPTAPRQQG